MKPAAASAGTGLAGTAGGWLVAGDGGLSLAGIAIVTGLSCLFGMLSSASRLSGVTGGRAVRMLLMNAGAVWIAAYSLALFAGTSLAGSALIGLGVGLAGTKVLEVIESSAVAVARRVTGARLVTEEELNERFGDERQRTAGVFAERAIERKREAGDGKDS